MSRGTDRLSQRPDTLYFAAVTSEPAARPKPKFLRLSRADLVYCLAVVAVYVGAMLVSIVFRRFPLDRMAVLAEAALTGHLDSPTFKGTVDTVEMGGRYYVAVGPLQLAPY